MLTAAAVMLAFSVLVPVTFAWVGLPPAFSDDGDHAHPSASRAILRRGRRHHAGR